MMRLQLNLTESPPAAHTAKVWPLKEVVREKLACSKALEDVARFFFPVLNIAVSQNMFAGIFAQPGVLLSLKAQQRADVLFSKGVYYAFGAMMAHAFHFDDKLIVESNRRSHHHTTTPPHHHTITRPHHYTTPPHHHTTTPHHTTPPHHTTTPPQNRTAQHSPPPPRLVTEAGVSRDEYFTIALHVRHGLVTNTHMHILPGQTITCEH
jgi:hypothetical protein